MSHQPTEARMRRIPIEAWLLAVMGLVGGVPLGLFAAWLGYDNAQSTAARLDQERADQVAQATTAVTDYVALKGETLEVTAWVLGGLEAWTGDVLQRHLDAHVETHSTFDGIYVGTPDGVSLAFAPTINAKGSPTPVGKNYTDRGYYKHLMKTGELTVSKVLLGKATQVHNVMIAVPVWDTRHLGHSRGREMRGFIVGGLALARLGAVVQRTLPDPAESEVPQRVLIVDDDGKLVVDSAGKLKPAADVAGLGVGFDSCPAGEPTTFDLDGKPMHATAGALALPGFEWCVWALQSDADRTRASARARAATLEASALVLGVTALISLLLASRIQGALAVLIAIARRLGDGDFTVRSPTPGPLVPAELAQIASTVDTAIAQLQSHDQEVQALVTRLAQANKRLTPFAAAWRQVQECIEILDTDGRVQFANPAAVRLLGPERTAAGTRSDVWAPALELAVTKRHSWSDEIRVDTADGVRIFAASASPIIEDDSVKGIVVIRHDITDRRAAEATAADSARLASVGTLAAGLAHEINNPLTAVTLHLDELRSLLSNHPDPGLQRAARDARHGLNRVAVLVRNLLRMARAPSAASESADTELIPIEDLVDGSLSLARPHLRGRATVHVDVGPRLHWRGRWSELGQVVLNLVLNAVQAAKDKPIEVRVHGVLRDDAHSRRAVLIVEDDGPGVPLEIRDRIFEPFYTTKPVGQGTGLGLSVSRSIVAAHQGELSVDDSPLGGARFTVSLPAAEAPAAELQPSPAPTPLHILLIDDEPSILRTFARMLTPHKVTTALGGIAALEALESIEPNAIVCDVMMPDVDGPTVFGIVRNRWPQLVPRFLFVTGAARNSEMLERLDATGRPVHFKPVTRDDLLRWVQQAAEQA